jgi:hypothetical protein
MMKLRKFAVLAAGALTSIAVYATCDDIRANCQRAFDLDNANCNQQPPISQENCYKRSHEAFLSCLGSCK